MADLEGKFAEALQSHQRGELERARELYAEILSLKPDHPDSLHLLGVLAAQAGNPRQAVQLISRAIVIAPANAMMFCNRAAALQDLQQWRAALENYDRAVALDDRLAHAYSNRAVVLAVLGDLRRALASCDRAIGLEPRFVQAHFNRGNILREMGRTAEALASYDVAVALKPDYAAAWFNRGNLLKDNRDWSGSLHCYERCIAIRGDHAEAHANRGNVLKALERWDAALESYEDAIRLRPKDASSYCNRASVLSELGKPEAALASVEAAIAIDPKSAEAYSARGTLLNRLGRLDEALADCDRAVTLDPGLAGAYTNRGVVNFSLKRWEAAIADYDAAIALDPTLPEPYANRAAVERELGRFDAALQSCDRAIAVKADHADAHFNKAIVLRELRRLEASIESFDAALACRSRSRGLLGLRLSVKMQICDWHAIDQETLHICALIADRQPAAPPLTLLALSGSAALQRTAAEAWIQAEPPASPPPSSIGRRRRREKIHIGYFSADYHNHATMHLMAGLFERHDRSAFELSAFSFGPDSSDAMRTRLLAACDTFIDVRSQSDREVAALARHRQVDIAVDLKGFTQDCRPGIFASGAAPLQVGFLGYPGTMGAPYIDYLVADRVLVPPESRPHYSESVIYLPGSYQINDDRRPISSRSYSREELDLPPTGFVFCCFNNSYKITPETFTSWMRILAQVEGSVLWLLEDNARAAENLRREASLRQIEPRRLRFAQRLAAAEHLARQRAADLFLDTLPYNAHTTTSDALWAGLPVLTLAGEAFASRVSASLLQAIGLPELITRARSDYEDLAVALATDPARLAAIRERLAAGRMHSPLFDTSGYTRKLEAAYAAITARREAGLAPADVFPPSDLG